MGDPKPEEEEKKVTLNPFHSTSTDYVRHLLTALQ
jgi:hypothetical protein